MKEELDDTISNNVINIITNQQAWHYSVVPYSFDGKKIDFYTIAQDGFSLEELEVILGYNVGIKIIEQSDLLKMLQKYYRRNSREEGLKLNSNSDSFIVDLIKDAKNLKSSDIHIETYEDKCRVRIRIDGLLVERYKLSKDEYPAVINKIKIMANLDIAEKRLPQDGRIYYQSDRDKFDIRISVLPTLYGEKIALRLLSNDASNVDISNLGFSEVELKRYLEGIKRPSGMLLISGPTGSGKTTTLYATLKILNKESRNILTIEDPVEYTLEGINQVQLKENIGFTFASALRTFLRQDPDVIMVGEIRDPETASMAIRASLTGHLVLSTIHTNSAWGIVSRLIDMGVPPFLLANTLNTAVAQRLVRLLCGLCKEKTSINIENFPSSFTPKDIDYYYVPVGCDHCHYTGYKGRKAIYEVVNIDSELAALIKNNNEDVTDLLKKKSITSLSESAYQLLKSGETSIDEIYSLLTT